MNSFKVLLASDLHGSNAAFRKLVALARQLKVVNLIVAGDWVGKDFVVLRTGSDGCLTYRDDSRRARSIPQEERRETLENWRNKGIYPVIISNDEQDNVVIARKARELTILRLNQWLDHGAAQLSELGAKLIAIPGNDDDDEVYHTLSLHPWVINVDEKVIRLFDYEVFGFGFSNKTPWNTPRELPESEILARLSMHTQALHNPRRSFGVIHVPPYASKLDFAPEVVLDGQKMPRETGRGLVPVGSRAVATFVKEVKPIAVFCGHCHESRGIVRCYDTICVNPGSQYARGTLCAYMLEFDGNVLTRHQYYIRQ